MERPINPSREELEADQFAKNPPVAILVFDNYIPGEEQRSQKIMQVRAAQAAKIWHSKLYKNPDERPFIVSFANAHENGDIAGSQKVARILRSLKIPEEKIITRTSTITATGDIRQLHSLAKEIHLEGPLAIATTDGMAMRTNQEVTNHQRIHNDFGPVYVIYPKHVLNSRLTIPSSLDPRAAQKMLKSLTVIARSQAVNHGPTETVARAFATIPPLRLFQHFIEEKSHPGMRQAEISRYAAERMKKASKRLKTLRRYAQILDIDPKKIDGLYKKSYPTLDVIEKQTPPGHG
jgi:hypothetical protein